MAYVGFAAGVSRVPFGEVALHACNVRFLRSATIDRAMEEETESNGVELRDSAALYAHLREGAALLEKDKTEQAKDDEHLGPIPRRMDVEQWYPFLSGEKTGKENPGVTFATFFIPVDHTLARAILKGCERYRPGAWGAEDAELQGEDANLIKNVRRFFSLSDLTFRLFYNQLEKEIDSKIEPFIGKEGKGVFVRMSKRR